jgi:hypothetical protein
MIDLVACIRNEVVHADGTIFEDKMGTDHV